MFNFYKTRYSIHFKWENITQNNKFIFHPINTNKYESKICPLGNLAGYLIPLWIFIRLFLFYYLDKNMNTLNIILWIFIII